MSNCPRTFVPVFFLPLDSLPGPLPLEFLLKGVYPHGDFLNLLLLSLGLFPQRILPLGLLLQSHIPLGLFTLRVFLLGPMLS